MATFVAWAKQNGQNQKALDSKLQDRKNYLMKFLCWQAKDKKAKLNSESKRTVTTTKTKKNLTGWKSLEFMKRELGEAKLDRLVELGKIKTQPCQRSGEDTREMREYWFEDKTNVEDVIDENAETTSSNKALTEDKLIAA